MGGTGSFASMLRIIFWGHRLPSAPDVAHTCLQLTLCMSGRANMSSHSLPTVDLESVELEDNDRLKEDAYEVRRPHVCVIALMVVLRTCCWYIVVGSWMLQPELILFIPLAGMYWALSDGMSCIGGIEKCCFDIPVAEPPSQKTVHTFLWSFVLLYHIKQLVEQN